jgi:hypothetical protein
VSISATFRMPRKWRLEVVTVYYDQPSGRPQIELFTNVPI